MSPATIVRAVGPPAGIVDVWHVWLDAPGFPHDLLVLPLDAWERRRAERMRVGGPEWSSAHGARRVILASYLNQPAAAVRFAAGGSGKPRLAGVPGLEFSFARTRGLALLAVASDREVGVDVERENDRTDIDLVASEFLPPGDKAALEWIEPERRRSAFFTAWARHEARLKLYGQGLGGHTPARLCDPAVPVVVRALAPRPGFAAAVAAEGGGWTVRTREFTPALCEA